MEFCSSAGMVHRTVDNLIKQLEDLKKRVTEENFNHFSISTEESRNFDEICTAEGVTGFRQTAPDSLTITIIDTSNLGAQFITCNADPWSGPWKAPTRDEVAAVDNAMKKNKRVPKNKREKIASEWRKIPKEELRIRYHTNPLNRELRPPVEKSHMKVEVRA